MAEKGAEERRSNQASYRALRAKFGPSSGSSTKSDSDSDGDSDLHPRFEDVFPFGSRWRAHEWLKEQAGSDAETDTDDYDQADGLDQYNMAMFGPALTRLTANQALNMLQGKPMICWLREYQSGLSVYSTVQEKARELNQELTFCVSDEDEAPQWPPAPYPPRHRYWRWGGEEVMSFYGDTTRLPVGDGSADWVGGWPRNSQVFVYPEEYGLLVTDDNNCRDATKEEEKGFLRKLSSLSQSDAASLAQRFDAYLSFGSESTRLMVFLDPFRRRHTGRLSAAAPA